MSNTSRREHVILTFLSITATLLALVLFEAAYRVHLAAKLENHNPLSYSPDESPSFTFLQPPGRWAYNADYGFDFISDYLTGQIKDGVFSKCGRGNVINKRGNLASRPSRYDDADLKGLLVGSSYTMGSSKSGLFFHEVLEDILAKKTSVSIGIENFSRDSFGVIQMFDMAVELVKTQKPDFVIIAFNTATLSMPRHWRTVLPHKDGFYNFYFMIEPAGDNPTPQNSYIHRFVVNDKVTNAWCDDMMQAKKQGDTERLANDPVIRSLIERYNEILRNRHAPEISVDLTTLSRSFLYNRIVHGNTFWEMDIYGNQVNALHPLQIKRYDADEKYLKAVDTLKKSGIPVILIHIPAYPELLENSEWAATGYGGLPKSQELSLALSLVETSGFTVESLLGRTGAPREDAASLAVEAEGEGRDWHPNAKGIALFTNAISDLVIERLNLPPPE